MLSKGRHADGRKQELWERREVGWLWFSFAEKRSSSLLTPITARSGKDEDGQFPITVMLGELIWCVVAGCLKPSGAEQPRCSKTILPAKGLGLGPAAPPNPGRGVLLWCAGRWTTNRRWPELGGAQSPVLPFSLLYGIYRGITENWRGSGRSLSRLCASFYGFSGTAALHSSLSRGPGSSVSPDTHPSPLHLVPLKPPTGGLCTVTSPCCGTADALSRFCQFRFTLLSNHPDKPVSLSAYNRWIPYSLDHTCLSVVQKDYVRLEFSTYFNKWMIAALYNLFMFGLCSDGLDFGYSIASH